MGYILEFRDETDKQELMTKLRKAKKAVCEALEAMEDAEEAPQMQERGHYHDGMGYRGARMRDDRMMRDERMDRDEVEYRRGRYGY